MFRVTARIPIGSDCFARVKPGLSIFTLRFPLEIHFFVISHNY